MHVISDFDNCINFLVTFPKFIAAILIGRQHWPQTCNIVITLFKEVTDTSFKSNLFHNLAI